MEFGFWYGIVFVGDVGVSVFGDDGFVVGVFWVFFNCVFVVVEMLVDV